MLTIDEKLCWSPSHPFEYAFKLPSGAYFSHMGAPINRAFGLIETDWINSSVKLDLGLHHWNIAWLVTPLADKLPEMVKAVGNDLFALHNVSGARTPAEFGEIAAFASQNAQDLYLPPTRFVTRMKNFGYKELFGMDIDSMMVRARWAESVGVERIVRSEAVLAEKVEDNVMYVQFGKRTA